MLIDITEPDGTFIESNIKSVVAESVFGSPTAVITLSQVFTAMSAFKNPKDSAVSLWEINEKTKGGRNPLLFCYILPLVFNFPY